MLDANEACQSAVTMRVRAAWKKFRQYLLMLTGKIFFQLVYTHAFGRFFMFYNLCSKTESSICSVFTQKFNQ